MESVSILFLTLALARVAAVDIHQDGLFVTGETKDNRLEKVDWCGPLFFCRSPTYCCSIYTCCTRGSFCCQDGKWCCSYRFLSSGVQAQRSTFFLDNDHQQPNKIQKTK